jgi:hypothetical protein
MAKAKVNKSEVIRQLMAENPNATAAELAEKAKAKGVPISVQLVYNIRANASKKKPGAKKAAPARGHADGAGAKLKTLIELFGEEKVLRAAVATMGHEVGGG